MTKRTCPRCGMIPRANDGYFHRGFGALSRTDNRSYVCSDCGVEEAMEDFLKGGATPKSEWPVKKETWN